MSFVKHAVIAAAGLGSRLGMGKPKCLIEFDGMTILEHQLKLLDAVEDVRVVVGFEEQHVIELIRSIRPDTLIVRNPGYRSTTTQHSYAMGAAHLEESCLFLDGDILFQPSSFDAFLHACKPGQTLVGITEAKTRDAVYVELAENGQILGFSRDRKSEFEWANLLWITPQHFTQPAGAVFERLALHLPLASKEIVCNEIDTREDMEQARANLDLLKV